MRRAHFDPSLDAVARAPRSLHYTAGADPSLDRPGHVRAASASAWVGPRLAIVQDDAHFLALVDPRDPSAEVASFPLAADAEGKRLFDETRGNKKQKLDLEACVVVPTADGPVLLAFGSGSTSHRENVVVARGLGSADPDVRTRHAPELYASLRGETAFAGSELNIEGVARVGELLRMFNRGNGAPRGDLLPVDATTDLPIAALLAYLFDGAAAPSPSAVVGYDLGAIDGVRLGFTDAVAVSDRIFYLAAAEASPDAYHDGPVTGVVLGVIDGEQVRCARVRTDTGFFDRKAEGLAFDPDDPRRGFLVVDRDAPLDPAELWQLELSGPW